MPQPGTSPLRGDLRSLSADIGSATKQSAGLLHTFGMLSASMLGLRSVTSSWHDVLASNSAAARSDVDEYRARLVELAQELKSVSDAMETFSREGRSITQMQSRKAELLAGITDAESKLRDAERRGATTARVTLEDLIKQITSVKGALSGALPVAAALNYLRVVGEFNRTLAASNQSLGARNRLLELGLETQQKTGLALSEVAELFEGFRQQGVMYLDSADSPLRAYSLSAAGANHDLVSMVESANKLAVATGVSRQEASNLLAVSQQLGVSYQQLAELTNQITKRSSFTGQGAVDLVSSLSDLRMQYNVGQQDFDLMVKDVAALQDAMKGVGIRDSGFAAKWAGAMADMSTSTGQFALMFGTGGDQVLRGSGQFLAATENIAKMGKQLRGNEVAFADFAGQIGLSRTELQALIRVVEEGRFAPARDKLNEAVDLNADYEDQLVRSNRAWTRLKSTLSSLVTQGLPLLTWGIEKLNSLLSVVGRTFSRFPEFLQTASKLAILFAGGLGLMKFLSTARAFAATIAAMFKGLRAGSVASTVASSVSGGSGHAASTLAGDVAATAAANAAGTGIGNWFKRKAMAGGTAAAAQDAAIKGWATAGQTAVRGWASSAAAWIATFAKSSKAFAVEWAKSFKPTEFLRGIASWWKALDFSKLAGALVGGLKSAFTGLRGFLGGLLGPTSWLGRAFLFLTGPLGLIVTAITGIYLLVRKWLGDKLAEKNKSIQGVYAERQIPKDMIGKAIRNFQEKAQSQKYSPTQLQALAETQLKSVESYARRAAEIAKASAEAGYAGKDNDEFKKIVDVGMVLQSDVQRLIAAQADVLGDMRAQITGAMVAEGPHATVARMDNLDAERDRYEKVIAEISTGNSKVVDALSKIAKYADQFANEARRRDDEERAQRQLERSTVPFIAAPYGIR